MDSTTIEWGAWIQIDRDKRGSSAAFCVFADITIINKTRALMLTSLRHFVKSRSPSVLASFTDKQKKGESKMIPLKVVLTTRVWKTALGENKTQTSLFSVASLSKSLDKHTDFAVFHFQITTISYLQLHSTVTHVRVPVIAINTINHVIFY